MASLLFPILLIPPGVASAAPVTAEEWNAVGVEHRRRLEPEKALEAFRNGHAFKPSPKSRGQMGFAEHDLGQYVAAEQHLVEALAAQKDAWVIRNRRFLAEALALTRLRLGHVSVQGPPGATVRVDGAPVGTLPLSRPLSVPEGEIWIAVSAPGHLSWEQRLTVTGGKDVEVIADLVPDRRDLPDISPSSNQPDALSKGLGTEGPLPDQGARMVPALRLGAWTLVGLGAALGGMALWSYKSRQPSCPAGNRVCNESARSLWPTLTLAGGSTLAVAGGIALFLW